MNPAERHEIWLTPQKIFEDTPNAITIRPVEQDDLDKIEELCATTNFEIGSHNLHLYFDTSHVGWLLAIVDATQKVVSFRATHHFTNPDCTWEYCLVTHPDTRNLRITSNFDHTYYFWAPVINSFTNDSTTRFGDAAQEWYDKKLAMQSDCVSAKDYDRLANEAFPLPDNIRIVDVTPGT
jgi:hypothetical protein